VGLFDQHPIVVVSLDYIKSERHREHFLSIAPECIIVDEAHTCASSGAGKQLRFELLQRLAKDTERHLLLLTATPHSATKPRSTTCCPCSTPAFVSLQSRTSADDPLRQQLARHFVQRRPQRHRRMAGRNPRRPGLCPPHENRAHLQAHRRLGRLF
jgi:hypothetical protein